MIICLSWLQLLHSAAAAAAAVAVAAHSYLSTLAVARQDLVNCTVRPCTLLRCVIADCRPAEGK